MMEYGGQYAVTFGAELMRPWYVDNLDTPVQVLVETDNKVPK